MKWNMYEFANADIPESVVKSGYKNPEEILENRTMYIPIITFNVDSSEMGGYAFKVAHGE